MNDKTMSEPVGLTYRPAFLTTKEEAALVHELDRNPWSHDLKRRVQHFGYRYDYRARTITPDSHLGPLPSWLRHLGKRLVDAGHFDRLPDQVIANEYLPGQGISAHVDCVPCFGDAIISISLLSPCEMVFREVGGAGLAAQILEPCSLLMLKGPARYNWTHEIPARRNDVIDGVKVLRARRVSLTFRTVDLTTH